MNNKKPNAALVWKQLDDFLVPNLALNTIDRAVYSHLLRHSRLEGKRRLRFSMNWLARGVRICDGAARPAIHRLIDRGVLRIVERGKTGHVVEVRLPAEVRALFPQPAQLALSPSRVHNGRVSPCVDLEKLDFYRSPVLRKAIHVREGGSCFYCLRRLTSSMQCLDHVVPQIRWGRNSYRNLVSCCLECNSRKSTGSAADLLRWLYRDRRLTTPELRRRLQALHALAAGKLRPQLLASDKLTGDTALLR